MKTKLSLFAILLVMTAVISCRKDAISKSAATDNYSATPVLPATVDNYVNSNNDHLATLGRVLFYDKSLSLNNSVACASCHQQSKAFCDNLQYSVGLDDRKTVRNAPSIFAKSGRAFWDGRVSSMQNLVLSPVKNHIEMKFENLDDLAKKISGLTYYAPLFSKAFGTSDIDSLRIKLALAEFIKNFNFSDNKFSRSLKNQEALNASEAVGKNIFFGKGLCFNCHHIEGQAVFSGDSSQSGGYGFTDMDFNIGLDETYSDNGIGSISGNAADNGKFMVPVLLNVEYTSPYMHDGRYKTLEEVVEHYNSGIQNHPNLAEELRDTKNIDNLTEAQVLALLDTNHNGFIDQSEISSIAPVRLNLSTSEKRSLVDFLKTLSDPSIFTEAKFKSPFTSK